MFLLVLITDSVMSINYLFSTSISEAVVFPLLKVGNQGTQELRFEASLS